MQRWGDLTPFARGATLMLGAIFAFSIMDAVAKFLTGSYHPVQVVWARYTFQLVFVFLIAAPRLRTLLRTKYPRLQLVRSAFLFGATVCFFLSLPHLKLVTVIAIFEVAPLVICLFAFFFLGEPVGWRRWAGVTCGLVGALIIIRPAGDFFTPAALLPLMAAAFFAAYAVSTRFLGQAENPWTSFLYTALIGTIGANLCLPFFWTTPEPTDVIFMAILGAGGGIGHLMLIRALVQADASALSLFNYCGLIYGAILGYVVFSEVPDMFTVVGSVFIVSAGIFVWYRENQVAARNRQNKRLSES
ncbi:MAG: DMT family transporter [Rhodobacteraceae bacterium]|nr:DMT family transporter [Paracoccaceae bacterium]